MGASQRRKGHAWEREVAREFRAVLGVGSDEVKRGLSQPRGGGAEEPDVKLPDTLPWWVECKVGKRTDARAAMRQARADMAKAKVTNKRPLAVCKDDHQTPVVMLELDDFLGMVAAIYGKEPGKP